jgi:hypothetical protein
MHLSPCSRIPVLVLVATTFAAPVAAQVPPGQYLAAVRAPAGEMYYVDTQTRKSTPLTISATLGGDWANCVAMQTPALGYIGTWNNPAVYEIKLSGTTVTEKKLNTSPIGTSEVVQIQLIGSTLYFAQGSGSESIIWTMPVAGGAPTKLVDLALVTGWRAGGIVNSLAATITDIYVGIWTVGEVYVYNLATKTTKLLLTLPTSKLPSTSFYPVNMQMRAPAIVSKELICCGLYGDVVTVDVTTGKVINHYFHATPAGTGRSTAKDSIVENTDTGDFMLGSRDGAADVLVPVGTGQLGRGDVDDVGSNPTRSGNRVVGIWYNTVGADYKPYGAGCAGAGGYIPTSVARGAPKAGNSGFGFGIDTTRNGTATTLLVVGLTKSAPYPFDLTIVGAPGCFQRTDIVLLIPGSATGIGDGWGSGTIKAPLPKITATVHTQWAVYDPTNNFGIVMSDARTIVLK